MDHGARTLRERGGGRGERGTDTGGETEKEEQAGGQLGRQRDRCALTDGRAHSHRPVRRQINSKHREKGRQRHRESQTCQIDLIFE